MSNPARKRLPIVPPRVKVALQNLFADPKNDLAAAAATAGMPLHKLREQLKLGHVRAYAMHERRVLLDALIAGNPAALKEIRDRSGNDMARVNAIKTAEALRELADDPQRGAGVQRSQPGLVVIIQSNDGRTQQVLGAPVAPLQIEAETDAVDLEP